MSSKRGETSTFFDFKILNRHMVELLFLMLNFGGTWFVKMSNCQPLLNAKGSFVILKYEPWF